MLHIFKQQPILNIFNVLCPFQSRSYWILLSEFFYITVKSYFSSIGKPFINSSESYVHFITRKFHLSQKLELLRSHPKRSTISKIVLKKIGRALQGKADLSYRKHGKITGNQFIWNILEENTSNSVRKTYQNLLVCS